ncbi:M18 family aminopeptidase [Agromyces sp. MMS24-JH15]|uniref:M18 family aminopeptidase n=1 Tax=Agromyces sp. MMS24-JH15 TaxID=3243765 RepID=UPI003749CECC
MPTLATDAHLADFAAFLQASPSSFHAAAEVGRRLDEAGFDRLDEADAWPEGPGRRYVIRDGAVIAWVEPDGAGPLTPFRILGAHTDSPGFKLKPNPSTTAAGLLQAAVEVYGGPLLNSWLDRELELAGRVVTTAGEERLVRTGPLLRIPQLAIHLDREVSSAGLTLDKQTHMQPIWGAGAAEDLLDLLADLAGVDRGSIAGHDLLTADTAAPARFGRDDVFFAAGRMDNLSSVFAGLVALLAAPSDAPHASILAAFDHEEIGSGSRSGAEGPFLEDVLARIAAGRGADEVDRRRAFAGSVLVSADAGHGVHPNYPDKHDPVHRPVLGGGPLLKLNANQRYASDAVGSALWAEACARAGVGVQAFVSNNRIPCGSTIGPIAATRLGIRTVDVGVPLLSMHSARELAHTADLTALAEAMRAVLVG